MRFVGLVPDAGAAPIGTHEFARVHGGRLLDAESTGSPVSDSALDFPADFFEVNHRGGGRLPVRQKKRGIGAGFSALPQRVSAMAPRVVLRPHRLCFSISRDAQQACSQVAQLTGRQLSATAGQTLDHGQRLVR